MLTALCNAIPIASDGVPSWVHLLPAGEIHTVDGRGPYRLQAPEEIAAKSLAAIGGRMPIDEDHATDLAAPNGLPAPARGWIKSLEARSDGIWGEVEWTEAGKALVAGRAYRCISPVITHTKDNRVTAILRASLVNTPNLRGLTALHQQLPTAALTESDREVAARLGIDPDVMLRTKLETIA